MQIKKEMKHAVAIGLFIVSLGTPYQCTPPPSPLLTASEHPFFRPSELQTNANTLLPFIFSLLTGLNRYQHFCYLRLRRVLRLHGM